MKKILMILAMALVLGACSKDDEAKKDEAKKDEPVALNQQIEINGAAKNIKGALFNNDGYYIFCFSSADYTSEELSGMNPYNVLNKSHSMFLRIDSDAEMGETMSGTYNLAEGEGIKGKEIVITIGGVEYSGYAISVSSDGVEAVYTPDMTVSEPIETQLEVTSGTLTYTLSGKECEIKLDVAFSNGKTIRVHCKPTVVSFPLT